MLLLDGQVSQILKDAEIAITDQSLNQINSIKLIIIFQVPKKSLRSCHRRSCVLTMKALKVSAQLRSHLVIQRLRLSMRSTEKFSQVRFRNVDKP